MINLVKDELFSFEDANYRIKRVLSDRIHVVGENIETRETKTIRNTQMRKPILPDLEELYPAIPADLLTEEEEKLATWRFNVIKPFIDKYADPEKLKKWAKKHGVGVSTIYKWRARYQKTRHLSALIDREGRGGKGKSKLSKEQDEIIDQAIAAVYYKKKSIAKTFREVEILCKAAGIDVPNIKSVKKRVSAKTEETAVKFRRSRQKAEELFKAHTGKIPDAKYPFAIVQIDHTKLDIILVDPIYRKPLRRPWLTLLIDIYSRCPVGYYLSLDPPGNFGTGQAMAHAMYPKHDWLAKYEVNGEWPCWGAMKTIHADNAGEFDSDMLNAACLAYGIGLQWRPKKKPHYGAHIERLMGTFNEEIHALPGTTFSNIKERQYFEYDSKRMAAFTLDEFEQWLLTYITQVYMIRNHAGIGMSPLEKLKKGLIGEDGVPASGLSELYEDFDRLRMDYMPSYERTIQSSGVQIENMEYYSPLLSPYINVKEEFEFEKKRQKKKFIFKMDFRNIKKVYFLDPATKIYHEIPSVDLSCPDISIWEKREVERELKKKNATVDTHAIVRGYLALRELERAAVEKTQAARRRESRKSELETKPMPKAKTLDDYPMQEPTDGANAVKKTPKRFNNIDHGSFR